MAAATSVPPSTSRCDPRHSDRAKVACQPHLFLLSACSLDNSGSGQNRQMKRPSHEGSDTEGHGKAKVDVAANHDEFLLLRSRPFSLINVSAAFRVMGVAFRAYLR